MKDNPEFLINSNIFMGHLVGAGCQVKCLYIPQFLQVLCVVEVSMIPIYRGEMGPSGFCNLPQIMQLGSGRTKTTKSENRAQIHIVLLINYLPFMY